MSFFKATLAALAVVSQITLALAAPTVREGLKLSIRVADIVKNDHSAIEDHPLMGLYTDWLQTSPHAELIRRNASTVVERFPTFTSVDCYEDKNTCMLTSRMTASKDTVALVARQHKPDFRRRGWGWDTHKLVTEIHYKTYHQLENEDGEEEHSGFEQYVTWDWNVSYHTTNSALASLPCMREQCSSLY
jgi:hypothetical protein